MEHQLFRAAYDFFLLRAEYEPELVIWAKWWTTYLQLSSDEQAEFALPVVAEVSD